MVQACCESYRRGGGLDAGCDMGTVKDGKSPQGCPRRDRRWYPRLFLGKRRCRTEADGRNRKVLGSGRLDTEAKGILLGP